MDDFDTSRLIYLLLVLVFFVPGWLAMAGNYKFKYALVWLMIILSLCLGWAVLHPETFPIPLHPSGISHDI